MYLSATIDAGIRMYCLTSILHSPPRCTVVYVQQLRERAVCSSCRLMLRLVGDLGGLVAVACWVFSLLLHRIPGGRGACFA